MSEMSSDVSRRVSVDEPGVFFVPADVFPNEWSKQSESSTVIKMFSYETDSQHVGGSNQPVHHDKP